MGDIRDQFKRRLIIIIGKGGVGKTTIAAALALLASKQGKRVLLVEMDSNKHIPKIFGKERGSETEPIYENIFSINIVPQEAREEYFILQLKFRKIYNLLIKNRVMDYFFKAAPGINELIILGKIWYLEQQRRPSGQPFYDLIIFDSPATGHGISLLRVPKVVGGAVKIGPLAKIAQNIQHLLEDTKKTALNIVTIPEEMAINETIEMYHTNREILNIAFGGMIVNRVFPEIYKKKNISILEGMKNYLPHIPPDGQKRISAMLDCSEYSIKRRALNQQYIERLSEAVDCPLLQVPLLFNLESDINMLKEIGRILVHGFEEVY